MKKTKLYIITLLCFLYISSTPLISSASISADNEIDIEDNIYTISSVSNHMVLSIANTSNENAANVQVDKYRFSPYQQFLILKEYNGWYTIRNVASQLNLDVTNASFSPNTNLQQWTPNNTDAQLFKFYSTDNQTVCIQSKLGTVLELCIDNQLSSTSNVELQYFKNNISQKYMLNLIPVELIPAEITNGYYTICSSSNDTLAISIPNNSKISGTEAILDEDTSSDAQIFKILKESDGWYSIQNISSKLYLDIDSNSYLRQWIGTGLNSQRFKFYDAGNGLIIIKSKYGQVLSLSNNSLATKSSIILDLESNTSKQKWIFNSISN